MHSSLHTIVFVPSINFAFETYAEMDESPRDEEKFRLFGKTITNDNAAAAAGAGAAAAAAQKAAMTCQIFEKECVRGDDDDNEKMAKSLLYEVFEINDFALNTLNKSINQVPNQIQH